MKRLIILFLSALIVLGACSDQTEDEKQETKENEEKTADVSEEPEKEDSKEVDEDSIEVDKGLFDVEITIPASLIEGQAIDEIIENVKAEGVEEVDVNDDGSLTYYMSKSTHKDLLGDLRNNIQEYMEEMETDDEFASIKEMGTNKSHTKFTMIVDQEAYENSFDGFAALGVAIPGLYYQLFDGVNSDDLKVEVELTDEKTGEVFDTIIYPDALDELDQEEG